MVAVDSGCNRLVLQDKPTIAECPNFTYELSAVPCYLGTAAAGGRVTITGSGVITSEDGIQTTALMIQQSETRKLDGSGNEYNASETREGHFESF